MPYEKKWGHGQIVLEMFERLLEENSVAPTFCKDYPTEVSPLSRSTAPSAGWPRSGTWSISATRSAPRTPSWSTRWSSGTG